MGLYQSGIRIKLFDPPPGTEEIFMEKWKDIVGYEGMYQVSDNGSVRSIDRIINGKIAHGKILATWFDRKGYEVVGLWKDGVRKNQRVHRLVAEAFLPNPKRFCEVNHKNESKSENAVSNLEWCDRLYNVHFGTGIARMAEYKKRPILQLSKNGEVLKRWDSISAASAELEVDDSCISKAAKGKARYIKGFIWKYA